MKKKNIFDFISLTYSISFHVKVSTKYKKGDEKTKYMRAFNTAASVLFSVLFQFCLKESALQSRLIS